jgi:hypothetical protein
MQEELLSGIRDFQRLSVLAENRQRRHFLRLQNDRA